MKTLVTFSVLMATAFLFSYAARSELTKPKPQCTPVEISTVYIPILREVVDWPDEMIRPYAVNLCRLTKEKNALQKLLKKHAEEKRTGNFRICKDVIPGNPNPTDPECKVAYDAKVNSQINKCIGLIGLGHNPHNVGLILDPLDVEVRCLKGVNVMFL
jgi:hypothetical protein